MNIKVGEKDEIVMKLLHYFVAVKGYNPIIVKGVQNEIWLENLDSPYKVIRIVSEYIHNDEQFKFDLFKAKTLLKTIKKKTYSFKLNVLSIFVNLGDNVNIENFSVPNISLAYVNSIKDLNKYNFVIEAYPDIMKEAEHKEKGFELFEKITKDINAKNEGDMKMNDEVFSMKKPVITWALIIINVVLFILSSIFGFTADLAVNRGYVVYGEYYRLITGIFMHGGILHLLFNMYALYIIGMQLESFVGKVKYLTIYLLSGLAGSMLSIFFSSGYSVGASGAIFGLMGALLYFGYHYRAYLGTTLKSQIIPLIVLNLLLGFTMSGIDNWAHIGGLIGGVLATMAVGIKYKSTKFEMINGWILYLIYIFALVYMIFKLGL